jgi:glycosyl transferase, family 25
MLLNQYFDKIFYINLAKDVDRNNHILRQLEKFNITNFERFDAISYSQVPEQYLWRNFNKKDIKYITNSLGCKDSHLGIIKLAKQRGYKKVLILEDDIVFQQNPHYILELNQAILNDWDMLYFGGQVEHFFRNQIVGGYAYAVNHTLFDDILNMAVPSGMEIDNFYAKVLHHMSYNHNQSGKYNIRMIQPFNTVTVDFSFQSNIR